jgi:hypothetical protein
LSSLDDFNPFLLDKLALAPDWLAPTHIFFPIGCLSLYCPITLFDVRM